MIKFTDIIKEMPHVNYDSTSEKGFKNKLIDFQFEKMSVSQKEKQELLKQFLEKGIIAKYKNKIIKFTIDGAHFINKKEINDYIMLPKN
jgi:DNA-binding protein YbaB